MKANASQDLSKNQLRSQGLGWGPDGFAGGAGAAFAPGYSRPVEKCDRSAAWPGWGPDGSAGGAGAAFAPGYSVPDQAPVDHDP